MIRPLVRQLFNAQQGRHINMASLAVPSILLSLACVLGASSAFAATIPFAGFSSDGHPVSGSADFTLNAAADTATIKLTNTTTTTLDAGELFTGLDFSIGGLTPTLSSVTGIERTIDGTGAYVDTGSAQNLTWSLVSLGNGMYQLNFNPDAKSSIIGPPIAGNYSGANGSIKGNPGHNPFAAQMAVFELSVPNLETNTLVSVKTFRYGTTLDAATTPPGGDIPEPTTCFLALIGAATLTWKRPRRLC